METGEVRIGNKDSDCYLKATLYALDKHDKAILKALGGAQNNLLEVVSKLEEIDGLIIEDRGSIFVNNKPGLEVHIRRESKEGK